tara:strand:- start:487 stop:846 length:360 start_codon:yes stop_codon:yes gene_type:complete
MRVFLFSLMFMSPPNDPQQQQQISCPKWIGDSDVVAPAGVSISEEQKRNNTLRCYWQVVKPIEWRCKRNNPAEQCQRRTDQWLNNNFQTATNLRQACREMQQDRNATARTLMLNIRENR